MYFMFDGFCINAINIKIGYLHVLNDILHSLKRRSGLFFKKPAPRELENLPELSFHFFSVTALKGVSNSVCKKIKWK